MKTGTEYIKPFCHESYAEADRYIVFRAMIRDLESETLFFTKRPAVSSRYGVSSENSIDIIDSVLGLPLLDGAKEEAELMESINNGAEAYRLITSASDLRADEYDKLKQTAVKGTDSLLKFIEGNYGLVFSIVKPLIKVSSVPTEDLFSNGVEGMFRAIAKFDPNKGFKFSSYASQWIRKFVYEASIRERAGLRFPDRVLTGLERLTKLCDYYLDKYQRYPTKEEMEDEGCDPEYAQYMSMYSGTVMLDEPNEFGKPKDLLPPQDISEIDLTINALSAVDTTRRIIEKANLTNSELEIFVLSNGLSRAYAPNSEYISGLSEDPQFCLTSVAIGKIFGLSKPTILSRLKVINEKIRIAAESVLIDQE